MIDNLKYATISQIYIRDLIFYDPEKNAELISFCKHNGISLLPSSDRKSCYQLRAGSFKHMELTELCVTLTTVYLMKLRWQSWFP